MICKLILLLVFLSVNARADCFNKTSNDQFLELSKVADLDCEKMKASYGSFLSQESNQVKNKINLKVKDLIDTKAEILTNNLSKLDSMMALEGTSLPPSKQCSLSHLNDLLNCPGLEQQLKSKNLGSRKEFLENIGAKFTKQQNIKSSEESCVSKDALNYLMAQDVLPSLKGHEAISDEKSLQEFKDHNAKLLMQNPILHAVFQSMDSFKLFQKQNILNKSNYRATLSFLLKDEAFLKLTSNNLNKECEQSFSEIANMVCKTINLPIRDAQRFTDKYERKTQPNILYDIKKTNNNNDTAYETELTTNIYKGVACLDNSAPNSLSILNLIDDFDSYFNRKQDVNVKNLESSFENDESRIKDLVCQLKNYDCGKDQCTGILITSTDNCKKQKVISFSDLFSDLCLSPSAICQKQNICTDDSKLNLLSEYGARSKNITATIATTTTKKDETTGKETTVTTYETVRRVSSFAKSFHGDSKPAGTTLSIPTEKENVTVKIENAAGKDITREVAPEVAARQEQRPQQAPQTVATQTTRTEASTEIRTEQRERHNPTIDTSVPVNRISDTEMSGYRDLINDIQKSKRELKDSRDAEERKSLQDKIDKLEKEKQRFAANNNAPPTTNPRNVDGAQTPTILPQGATTTQRTYANSPRTTNDESAAPESTPTTNVKPAAPAATKSASAATATTPKTKGAGPANSTTTAEGTTGANQSTTTNTPVITEFPVQSQSDISLSTILEKDINILNEGKPFAIYENIKDESGKNIKISLEFEPIVKIDPVTKIKTIKFRPRLTQSNERLYNKMRKYKGNNDLLVSAKLSDGMKLN